MPCQQCGKKVSSHDEYHVLHLPRNAKEFCCLQCVLDYVMELI